MKKTVIISLGVAAMLAMTGCSDNTKKAEKEVVTYKYTVDQVYTQMCVKCHGKQGEGVKELDSTGKPKGPALNTQELYELKLAITDIKSGGLNQSSGTDREVMEHNMKAIRKKGMDYDTDKMAAYIFDHFNTGK